MKQVIRLIPLLIVSTLLFAPRPILAQANYDPSEQWADSLLNTLSLEEKIGQLFMVEVRPNVKGSRESVQRMIRDYKIGGVVFSQGKSKKQAEITNQYQLSSTIPLLVGIEGENGLGERLSDAITYPNALTLGAIQNNIFLYNMGAEIARQCQRIGVNMNFAPALDFNNEADKTLNGERSYGENKDWVARKGLAYMKGIQYNKVLACAKHFPGNEGLERSEKLLPEIDKNIEELKGESMFPFKRLIDAGLKSTMLGHLSVPSIDDQKGMPLSFSAKSIEGILREDLAFDGLVVTEALNQQKISKLYSGGNAELKAFMAGNDVILKPISLSKGVKAIKSAFDKGDFNIEVLDEKVRRILKAKYFAGLHKRKKIKTQNIESDLHSPAAEALRRDLYEQAITVVRNKQDVIPIKGTYMKKFAVVTVGGDSSPFVKGLETYTDFKKYVFKGSTFPAEKLKSYLPTLKSQDVIVLGIYPSSNNANKRFGISSSVINAIQTLQQYTKVITVVFGSPYGMKYLQDAEHLICAYEQIPIMQESVAQLVFGAIEAKGVLPVSVDTDLPVGTGIRLKSIGRLGYAYPENVGMDSEVLKGIDEIVKKGIKEEAMPGCQVLVAKDGKIIYEKAFGYQTYKRARKINKNSIYDLASITKVAGTLQGLMYLTDQGSLDIHQRVREHLPETDTTNKGDMVIKNILMHCAGLKIGYFFWGKVKNGRSFNYKYIRRNPAPGFSVRVSNKVYAKDSIKDDMWKWFLDGGISSDPNINGIYPYKYSDLGYYIFQKIIERQTEQNLNDFLSEKFYLPLGLRTMSYNPLDKFNYYRVVPTELDNYYRKNLVRGYVHDPSAALWGGVAGHAGLFSNAYDLAVLMQMNLQGGYYGGQRFFKKEVMELYNSQPYSDIGNHRALGWDKPRFSLEKGYGPTSFAASPDTFGHTGFTGTCAWADPEYNLVYVFLSNRVYPYARNKKLVKKNIRERIQSVIYRSMGIVKEEDHVFEQEQ
ncbi:glycoside hydrolase family 3 N-terminal domain-containing protein [Sediminitomix flava]|nr:glycoside hydrolase family 3 N-terminal domain-containing protein [Sediminitomix flava]